MANTMISFPGPGGTIVKVRAYDNGDGTYSLPTRNSSPVQNTPAVTQVARTTSPTTALVTNVNARQRMIHNNTNSDLSATDDGTMDLLVKFGAGVAADSFTYRVPPQAVLEFPSTDGQIYTGPVSVMWITAGTGNAQVTEVI